MNAESKWEAPSQRDGHNIHELAMASTKQLTIFLLKSAVMDPRDALDSSDALQSHSVQVGGEQLGTLHVRPSHTTPPSWARLFEGSVDINTLGAFNAGTAAVLMLESHGRRYALTFGYGRHLLRAGTWEERFGLKVTLNSINQDSLRSIDKKSFDAISIHSRLQVSQAVSAIEFGLNSEQDLLRAVTGSPTDSALGSRMSGIDALSVAVKVDLPELRQLLDRYHGQYQSTRYKAAFPWVDHIAEMRDPHVSAALDARLIEALQTRTGDRLWLAVPDILEWDKVGGFRYGKRKSQERLDDIHRDSFLGTLAPAEPVTIDLLKQRRVCCFNVESDFCTQAWPVYDCVYFETELNGATYLLSAGKWYSVDRDFVRGLDAFIAGIEPYTRALPDYADTDEGAYNQRVCANDGELALMDKNMISHGGGHSQIEFCDLFGRNGDLVHVKRYGGSSSLSHLFAQGLTSIELTLSDQSFREKVQEKLPQTHRWPDPATPPAPASVKVAFGVITLSTGRLQLPLFSKINLRHAARRIRMLGVTVCLAKIQATRPTAGQAP
jgi:uncharacterized protein (TIGR04141 family)